MYRPPRKSDLTAITEIYNDAILTTIGTFDTELKTEEEQKIWFEAHSSRYPILVAESEGAVTGWSSHSKWSDRAVYRETAELPLYVKREFRGKGIGGKLVLAIINEGKPAGLHTIIARIAVGNPASIRLAESVGYCRIGVMKEVGRKFGKLLDVHLMQIIYLDPQNVLQFVRDPIRPLRRMKSVMKKVPLAPTNFGPPQFYN